MNYFSNTLIGPSPLIRWILTPVIFLSILLALLVGFDTTYKVISIVLIEILLICLLGAIWLPKRIGTQAFRVVTSIIFFTYCWYVVTTFREGNLSKLPESRGDSNFWNALIGLIVIGLPCLIFSIFGKIFEDDDIHFVDLDVIDFFKPETNYLFSECLFDERKVFLRVNFDQSIDNSEKREFIESAIDDLDSLGELAYQGIALEHFEGGSKLNDSIIKEIFGDIDRSQITSEDFRSSLQVDQISIETNTELVHFKFAPHSDIDQWLVVAMGLDGLIDRIDWEG